jgi:toxin ParE1/3/4
VRVEWTLFAMNDREAIFDYLEADSPRAAILIDDRIETQVELLIDTPERTLRCSYGMARNAPLG